MSEDQCGCAFTGDGFQIVEMDCPTHGVDGGEKANEGVVDLGQAIYGIAGGLASSFEFQAAWSRSVRFHAEAIESIFPHLSVLMLQVVDDVELFVSEKINSVSNMLGEIYESLD